MRERRQPQLRTLVRYRRRLAVCALFVLLGLIVVTPLMLRPAETRTTPRVERILRPGQASGHPRPEPAARGPVGGNR